MKWLYAFSHFELPISDRNRYVPDRYVLFLISRNIGFVFPSVFSIPVLIPEKKIGAGTLEVFPTVHYGFQRRSTVTRTRTRASGRGARALFGCVQQ